MDTCNPTDNVKGHAVPAPATAKSIDRRRAGIRWAVSQNYIFMGRANGHRMG
eukprot:COSAG01_NODE_33436_length_564_cov_0.819355_1_plen_51_part_10